MERNLRIVARTAILALRIVAWTVILAAKKLAVMTAIFFVIGACSTVSFWLSRQVVRQWGEIDDQLLKLAFLIVGLIGLIVISVPDAIERAGGNDHDTAG